MSRKEEILGQLEDDQRKKINVLREQLKDKLNERHDDYYLFRFLKARNFDVEKAALMLSEEIEWRKAEKIDEILETWGAESNETRKLLERFAPMAFCGEDKSGCPVYIERHGQVDVNGLIASFSADDIVKHHIFLLEKGEQIKAKKDSSLAKHLVIEDCSGLSYAHFNTDYMAIAKRLLKVDEERYPELPRKLFVVNAPWVFTMLWALVKPWLQQRTIDKVQILGSNYKDVLLKEIDAEQLPKVLGGEAESPSLGEGGKIPVSYHKATAAEASSSSSTSASGEVKEAKVSAGAKHEVLMQVKSANTMIGYEFWTANNDIGFQIDLLTSSDGTSRTPVKALAKYNAHKEHIQGSLTCPEPGEYCFSFDNTHSFFKSKQLSYTIFKSDCDESIGNLDEEEAEYQALAVHLRLDEDSEAELSTPHPHDDANNEVSDAAEVLPSFPVINVPVEVTSSAPLSSVLRAEGVGGVAPNDVWEGEAAAPTVATAAAAPAPQACLNTSTSSTSTSSVSDPSLRSREHRKSRSLPMKPRVSVDDFEFIKLIGQGGFGKVFLAELHEHSVAAQMNAAAALAATTGKTKNGSVVSDAADSSFASGNAGTLSNGEENRENDRADDGAPPLQHPNPEMKMSAAHDDGVAGDGEDDGSSSSGEGTSASPALPRIFAVKVFRKDFILKTNSVESTRFERDMLRSFNHPFIVRLHYAFQCSGRLYLCMDFLQGGQLFNHLRDQSTFTEKMVRFYTAELVLALTTLHADNIAHRDLKPENLLLDHEGHIRLTDFGFARRIDEGEMSKSFCGTLEYMSPEMISEMGHGIASDWWSVGILMFDMLTGAPPFSHNNRNTLQKRILNDRVKYPSFLTGDVTSLMKGLLQRDPSKRLTSKRIKSHKFFRNMSWRKVLAREIPVPYVPPSPTHAHDTCNFDEEYTSLPISMSPAKISPGKADAFKNFSYARSPLSFQSALFKDSDGK